MYDDHGLGADRAALADAAAELGMYLQRVAQAIRTGRVGELAHDISGGASVASEQQLPLIFEHCDAEMGRQRGLAGRIMGRMLTATAREREADLARRRAALRPRPALVERSPGHVTYACPNPGESYERG